MRRWEAGTIRLPENLPDRLAALIGSRIKALRAVQFGGEGVGVDGDVDVGEGRGADSDVGGDEGGDVDDGANKTRNTQGCG